MLQYPLAVGATVLSFGANRVDQAGLGLGPDIIEFIDIEHFPVFAEQVNPVATPIIATNLVGKTITQASAGTAHSLLLANDGTVYSFGSNSDGQTGQNTSKGTTMIASPIVATNLVGKTIAQIASGSQHSLLLASDGDVFSFGFNLSGRTGLGFGDVSTANVATPINTTNLSGKNITQIAAGGFHSLLLTDDGTVFSFGTNFSGQTGLGTMR